MLGSIEESNISGPPQATLKRRAQSYTDFHHAVRAVLGKDERTRDSGSRRTCSEDFSAEGVKVEAAIRDDLDFADWYHDLEHALLDSSNDEYTYDPSLL